MTSSQTQVNGQGTAAVVLPTVQKKKPIIWVTGGKGGTGKSTFARGALDVLRSANKKVAPFDGDPENAQLHRYYQRTGNGVFRTELNRRDGGDDLLEEMEERAPDIILADVAAGGSQILMQLEEDAAFLSDATQMGYQFTIVSVISPIKDSVNMLNEALKTTAGHDVRHVVVKNLKFGDDFELFDDSKIKQQFKALGGIVITMRGLMDKTYTAVDKYNLPFSEAEKKESGLSRGDRNRIRQWLTCLHDQMILTEGALGL